MELKRGADDRVVNIFPGQVQTSSSKKMLQRLRMFGSDLCGTILDSVSENIKKLVFFKG